MVLGAGCFYVFLFVSKWGPGEDIMDLYFGPLIVCSTKLFLSLELQLLYSKLSSGSTLGSKHLWISPVCTAPNLIPV